MSNCTDYHTYKIEYLAQNINHYLKNKSAVYLFKFDFNSVIDYSSDSTVLQGIESLITKTYHEKREDMIGLFFNTTIELTSNIFRDKKRDDLIDVIAQDSSNNYKNIKNLLNIITENQHPLYIGKANKLASRIKQHLSGGGQSKLKENLAKYNIDIDKCILSFHYIDDNLNDSTNELFEDVITRILKPGFVRRIG